MNVYYKIMRNLGYKTKSYEIMGKVKKAGSTEPAFVKVKQAVKRLQRVFNRQGDPTWMHWI